LVKQIVTLLRKELKITSEKERLVLVTTFGTSKSVLDEDAVLPVLSTYSVYATPRLIVGHIVKPGPLLVVENLSINAYNKSLTHPLVINFNKALNRENLIESVLPVLQERYWRESAKSKDSPMGSKDYDHGSAIGLDGLKEIQVEAPSGIYHTLSEDPEEVGVYKLDLLTSLFSDCRPAREWKIVEHCFPVANVREFYPNESNRCKKL
jgi:hypothetical protein